MTFLLIQYNLSFSPFEATSSSVGNDPGVLQYPYYADPADWSVEEVILFLKEVDPHTLLPLADLFREHVTYLLIWFSCL